MSRRQPTRRLPLNQIHEIPRCLTICGGLEYDVQVGRRPQRLQQRPKGKPLTSVPGQTEVDLHVFDAGVESFRWDCRQI